MSGRQVASKWLKTMALLSDPRIVDHIPKTRIYNESDLYKILDLYNFVVIKPIVGSGGVGVIKVVKNDSTYRYTHRDNTHSFKEFDAMVYSLSTVKKKRPYIIQRGIQLATIDGRPIDYRAKVVKSKYRWSLRGIVGRLAREGLFVTNLCRGGTKLTVDQGISQSLPNSDVLAKKIKMRELTRIGTEILEQRFPGIGQLGFDYGIDTSERIWIFEVNTRPQ